MINQTLLSFRWFTSGRRVVLKVLLLAFAFGLLTANGALSMGKLPEDELNSLSKSSLDNRPIASTIHKSTRQRRSQQLVLNSRRNYPAANRVQVELFVMSRCPDARLCESIFSDVLSQVGSITDISSTYIAKSPDTQPVCKHGPLECDGNRQQLCVRKYYPDPSIWFRFLLCQNDNASSVGQPELAETCATKVGISYNGTVRTCAEGEEGERLFVASAQRAIDKGIQTSCTMRINDQPRCVHDAVWRDCPAGHEVSDFVRDICNAYTGQSKPEACANQQHNQ